MQGALNREEHPSWRAHKLAEQRGRQRCNVFFSRQLVVLGGSLHPSHPGWSFICTWSWQQISYGVGCRAETRVCHFPSYLERDSTGNGGWGAAQGLLVMGNWPWETSVTTPCKFCPFLPQSTIWSDKCPCHRIGSSPAFISAERPRGRRGNRKPLMYYFIRCHIIKGLWKWSYHVSHV